MINSDAQAYKNAEILGKSPIELVLQVYDGAIAELKAAKSKYEDNSFADGYNHLQRAERMVTHLYTTLDMNAGGDIAANLAKLYAWVITKLHEVQATKEIARFDECIRILNNLREAWEAIRLQKTTPTNDARPAPVTSRVEVVG